MTNASLTAMHAILSTPLPRKSAARSTKPGKCFASHVGVNAPGTENNTTLLPLKNSSALTFCGPSFVTTVKVPEGILSPTLIVMVNSSLRLEWETELSKRKRRVIRWNHPPLVSPNLQNSQRAACAENV